MGQPLEQMIGWSTTLFRGDRREFHFVCILLTPPDTKHVPNKYLLSK